MGAYKAKFEYNRGNYNIEPEKMAFFWKLSAAFSKLVIGGKREKRHRIFA